MNFQLNKKIFEIPILLLIVVNILAGVLTFQDFGTAWDEPLFYSYGDALGYAYSPKEWFSGEFDFYKSYGASGNDHKNRGPAYLFLARNFVYGLKALGFDSISAWHLINFLFFQLGVYFLYRFSRRWMNKPAATFTAIFFSFQPLLWGHAFINPKDPPFLTFFLASVCTGFEMVDAIAQNSNDKHKKLLLASFFLGIATSIRVLGPMAGVLVFVYFLFKGKVIRDFTAWRSFVYYGIATVLISLITWPYLWENPIGNFIKVLYFMSDNPTVLGLVFEGVIYRANDLPARYFPFMFATTLTEPTIPLFILGIAAGYWQLIKRNSTNIAAYRDKLISLFLLTVWFGTLVAYIFIRRPSMYDGIRHFLFILPPVFVFIGLAYEGIMEKAISWFKFLIPPVWLYAGSILVLILPGLYGIIKLHPYQYTYYNFFIGGTNGAYHNYETDYWLTCYRDAVEQLNALTDDESNLYVKREAYLAALYANDNFQIAELPGNKPKPGDYVLVNSRTNDDVRIHSKAPIVVEVTRVGARFCTIRQIK